jgi:RNA polymerase sigma-70 factor, ECF subfamily
LSDVVSANSERMLYVDVRKLLHTNGWGQGEDLVSFPCAGTARLIEAEIPFLRRTVRRWHRSAADADDLVQQTLLRALANAHLWQPGSNLRAWLATIMRNEFCAAAARGERWRAAAQMIDAVRPIGPDQDSRLTVRDVARALRRLPTKQRAVLVLAAIEGKSYAEIAETMQLSADAVRCHLARARDRLRVAVFGAAEASPIRADRDRPRARRGAAPNAAERRVPELV